MISICHLIESLCLGGAERGLLNILANPRDSNLNHRIIAFKDGPLKDDYLNMGIDVQIITRKDRWDFHFFLKLFKSLQQGPCDVVHARNTSTAIVYGGLAAYAIGIPFITSVHGYNMLQKKGMKAWLWQFMHRFANITIAVSESIAKELIVRGTRSTKVVSIRNGLDLEAYHSQMLDPEERMALRRELVGNDKCCLVGCVGSLREVKGQEFLLDAVAMMPPSLSDVKYIFAGTGPDMVKLQCQVEKLKLNQRVIFLGFRTDVFAILQVIDLIVVPSQSEGISNIILEAMAFRVPVVATAVGGTPEVIRDGENGLLVPYGDAAALAVAISTALDDKELCSRFIENGMSRMVSEFSLKRMVDEYESIYLNVANQPKSHNLCSRLFNKLYKPFS